MIKRIINKKSAYAQQLSFYATAEISTTVTNIIIGISFGIKAILFQLGYLIKWILFFVLLIEKWAIWYFKQEMKDLIPQIEGNTDFPNFMNVIKM